MTNKQHVSLKNTKYFELYVKLRSVRFQSWLVDKVLALFFAICRSTRAEIGMDTLN